MESAREILKKIRRLELKTRGMVEATFAGQYRSVFKGRGMNFEEVREYQPGDEVRTIDWNVTARLGEVRGEAFVKKFTEERELTVMLVVDVSASGEFGSVNLSKRELAAEVACLLAFSAIRNNDKVGLLLFSGSRRTLHPAEKGPHAHPAAHPRDPLLRAEGARHAPGPALDYLNQVLHRRSVVFLISDFQAPDFSQPAHGHRPPARPHRHPDRRSARGGTTRCRPAHARGRRDRRADRDQHLGSRTMRHTRVLRTSMRGPIARMRDFRRKRIDTISLKTNEDYVPPLRSFFRTRERRLQIR